tara:strand:+ start:310 stop:1269 length:960 start_codon:yes stop_codon:yes gene_type:complete
MNIIIYIIKKIIIKKAKKLPFKKREKILNFLYYIHSFKNLTIFNNEILNKSIYKEKKLSLQNLYYKAKFIYFTLTRFIYLYKIKQKKIVNEQFDLCANPLLSFPKKQKIILLHYNTLYIFRISDIIQLWNAALENHIEFSPIPSYLKNPYTNLIFKKHNLYNIYFAIKNSGFNIPLLIIYFFSCKFNIKNFLTNFYPILQQKAILNFIKSDEYELLFNDILTMFDEFKNILKTANIKKKRSLTYKKIVIEKTKHLLTLYYFHKFSCNPLLKKKCYNKLIDKLIIFENDYFNFGINFTKQTFLPLHNQHSILQENIIIEN